MRKGTEPPFSGEYDAFFADGLYVCRRCGAILYRSKDKFRSGCGWPSFDAEVPGAVRHTPDADGRRTEITCQNCQGHLGHVFTGEKLTAKNTRHCVNSLSLRFIPQAKAAEHIETAYLAGGCFWCVEAVFRIIRGVLEIAPGYAGGMTPHPTYESVSTGETGYAEIIRITYDPAIISYEDILKIFFSAHDPTTRNRQGNDVGSQYRSAIFFTTPREEQAANAVIQELEKEKVFAAPIVTEVVPLQKFHPAEEYHHDYYAKNPEAPYCAAVIPPKLAKIRKRYIKFAREQ